MKTIVIIIGLGMIGLANTQPSEKNRTRGNRQESVNHFTNKTDMEKQAMQVVGDFLAAVQQGNQEKLAASLHPDVTWSQPGKNRFAGQKKSRDDVFQMVGGMFAVSENTLQLTKINTLSVNGNQVACLVHWKATQPNGGILDVDNIDVYTVKDGQIVNAVVFSADVAQENDFWLY